MVDDITIHEQAASISDLAGAMEGAEAAASGLGRAFADTAKSGNMIWTVMGRLLSGSGLWRLQNRIRAVGNAFQIYYDQQEAARKAELESIKTMATLIDARDKFNKIIKEGIDQNDALFKTYETLYGKELAMEKLTGRANKELERTNKLISEKVKLSDKDFKSKLKYSRKAVGMTGGGIRKQKRKVRRLGRARTAAQAHIDEITTEQARIERMPTGTPLTLGGQAVTHEEAQRQLTHALEAATVSHGEATKAYSEGQEETERLQKLKKDLPGMEAEGIYRMLPKPIRNMISFVNNIWKFIKGIGKLVWVFLKSAVSALFTGMMYLGIIIFAIILLKPVIMLAWKKWKQFSEEFGPMRQHLNNFMETFNTKLKPLFLDAWDSMKSFFGVLSDPNATIMDALLAGKEMLFKVYDAAWKTVLAFWTEVGIPFLKTAGKVVWAMLDELKDWAVNTLFPYLYAKVPIWLDMLEAKLILIKDWLAEKVPIWAGLAVAWIRNTGWPFLREKLMALGKWFVMDFGAWVVNSLGPWVWEKMMALGRWFVEDFGAWVANSLWPWIQSTLWPWVSEKAVEAFRAIMDIGSSLKDAIFGGHTGGTVTKSGTYLVGEKGPEMVNLPTGAKIIPNHALNDSMSNSVTNNITVQVQGRIGASDSEVRDIAKKVGAMVSREINRTTASAVRM